jgi:hypothetical protein
MGIIKFDRMKESAPVVLNLIKESAWCNTYGMISVITVIPVLTFQVYEVWKCRKEGAQKIVYSLIHLVGMTGGACWMISDLFFKDHFRSYVKWIFNFGVLLLFILGLLSWRQQKKEKVINKKRVMMISKETRGIVFMHTSLRVRRPETNRRVMMARHRK